MKMDRYFINQPSTLQSAHAYHGMCVLAPRDLSKSDGTVYFIEGDVISAMIPINALSKGWPKSSFNKN